MGTDGGLKPYREAMLEARETYLRQMLDAHGWNVVHAAKAAGMKRTTFYTLMRRSGIKRAQPSKRGPMAWLNAQSH
jgi:transcriptional regulator of acetoin/glycerol metabolism